jgi:hypothetical protein
MIRADEAVFKKAYKAHKNMEEGNAESTDKTVLRGSD